MGMVQHHPAMNPPAAPICSVCIANYNGAGLLPDCLESVLTQKGGFSVEIIVHDDASTDNSLALLQQRYPQVEVLASTKNVGFSIGNNRMVAHARGEYVLLLNNDAALYPDALATLLNTARSQKHPGIQTLPQYDWISGDLVDRGCLLDPFYNPVPNLDPKRRDVAMVIGASVHPAKALEQPGRIPRVAGVHRRGSLPVLLGSPARCSRTSQRRKWLQAPSRRQLWRKPCFERKIAHQPSSQAAERAKQDICAIRIDAKHGGLAAASRTSHSPSSRRTLAFDAQADCPHMVGHLQAGNCRANSVLGNPSRKARRNAKYASNGMVEIHVHNPPLAAQAPIAEKLWATAHRLKGLTRSVYPLPFQPGVHFGRTLPRHRLVASRNAIPCLLSGSKWHPSAHSFHALMNTNRESGGYAETRSIASLSQRAYWSGELFWMIVAATLRALLSHEGNTQGNVGLVGACILSMLAST